jgi:hypothetical protein
VGRIDQAESRCGCDVYDRRLAFPDQPVSSLDLAPERIMSASGPPLAVERIDQDGSGALAAVRGRAEIRNCPRLLDTAADRLGDLLGAQRPLEGVRSD